MTDQVDPVAGGAEEARRDGYRKGLNLGLLTVAIPCGLLAAVRSATDISGYENVFRQIKVPMPALTVLVLETHYGAAAVLAIGVVGCAVATRVWGHRKGIILLNGGYLLLSLLWWTLHTTALHQPLMSLIEGMGQRSRY